MNVYMYSSSLIVIIRSYLYTGNVYSHLPFGPFDLDCLIIEWLARVLFNTREVRLSAVQTLTLPHSKKPAKNWNKKRGSGRKPFNRIEKKEKSSFLCKPNGVKSVHRKLKTHE